VLPFCLAEFVGKFNRFFDVLEHLFNFLVELLTKLGFVRINELDFAIESCCVNFDQTLCKQEGIHLVKRVGCVEHSVKRHRRCFILRALTFHAVVNHDS